MEDIENTELVCKRMNIKNHLYASFPLMVFTFTISIGIYLFYQKYGIPNNSITFLMIFIYSAFALPAFFLQLEYTINDWGASLKIDNKNNKVIYNKGKLKVIFYFDEIECVYFFGETKDFNNLTTQNHSFYLFKLKNNKSFIISCLVIRNVESIFTKKIIIRKNRRLFPSILFENITKKNM